MQKLITLIVLLAFSLTATAQLGGAFRKAKNRLLDKVVERTVDKAADKVAEKASDKIVESFGDLFNADGTPKVDEDGNPKIGNLRFLQGPPKVVEPNPQTISFTMNMESAEGNSKIDYAFDTWKTGMSITTITSGSERSEVKIFHDLKEKTSTMAMKDGGEWSAFRTWMMDFSVIVEETEPMQVTATGRTKTIEGYTCKEYLVESEDGKANVWITEDISIDMFKLSQSAGVFGKRNGETINQGSNFATPNGFWLESHITSKNGETAICRISDVRKGGAINRSPFDLSGISIEHDLTKGIPME